MAQKSSTTEIFIEKSKKIHNNKFDYSKVKYINNYTKIIIICPMHGEFEQEPSSHLKGCGCAKCKGFYKTTADIIDNFKTIHKNFYDYSETVYKNARTKIEIKCPIHGKFLQSPAIHLRGGGCDKCRIIKTAKTKSLNTEIFIDRAKKIHNNFYDYSKVNYINNGKSVIIICPIHGEFEQCANSHLKGAGCAKCKGFYKNNDDIIKQFIEVHGNLYDYSKVKYINATTHIEIICKEHGTFIQRPSNHLNGAGCQVCKKSKGEKIITNYLNSFNIKFVKEKIFKNCRYINPLPFDFYIESLNMCIEYDGEQHYLPISFSRNSTEDVKNKNLNLQRIKDEIKNKFCYENNIKLLRIPYFEKHNIYNILSKEILNI